MKKRILSILLCFCMVLSLLPVPVLAASTHTLTVTGGVENVDYQWGGYIYTTYGELYKAENVLVILTSKELTITGDTKNQAGFKDAISINSGITANLTLNGVNLVSSSSSAGVTIAPGGTLNLTLQGTNTFIQNAGSDFRNCPAIRIPEGASLTVTDKSTGSLTSSTSNGSAVIGGYNLENCGTVTINGGTFDLSATGAENVDYIGGPSIGPGAYGRNGTITINGGYIKAYSQWGAAIGSGYNVVMGQIGQQNETISINGGTVVASSDNTVADGIGGYAKVISGGVTINGGSVSTTVRNTRPKNTGGNNLYKAALTLHGAAEGTLVNSLTAKTASGISYSYNSKDIVADSSGRIYVWLPEGSTVTNIIAGGTNYTGDSVVAVNDSETEIFYPESSTIKKYILTTEINDGRIVTLSDVKCDLTIYDKTGASEIFQNLPFEKDKNNPSRATVASYEFYTAKTDIQKIKIALCSGGISWEKDVAPDKNVWAVNIGSGLYKTMLIFRNEAITTDIAVGVTIKQGGTQLEADKGEFYVPHIITKQTEGYGTMEAYLPENSSSTEISVKAASLNGGNTITKIGQTITADNLTSLLMLNKTSSEAVVFTDTLDISKGNITFEDASGDLKITYSDTSGTQKNVTTFFEGKYRITGSTTSNGIRVLSTGGTTLQLVLDNVLMDLGCEYEQNPSPFNIEGESKVSLLLAGINKISSEVLSKRINSKAAICVKEKATLVIGGDGSLEASTSNSNYASVIGGSGWSQYYVSSVDHCGTIRIEGGDITLNGNKAGISSGYVGTGATGAVSNYGSFTMTGGNLKINSSDNAIGVKDINITGGTIDVGDKTIYGDNSLSVAGGTIVAGNFNAGGSGSITVTGGTMFHPNGEQTEMNKTAKNQAVSVYPVTADVSNIYGSNSAVSDAVITDVNYGFKDVKTDDNGVLHLYLPVNANTNTTFKGIAYQGAVSVGKDNILAIPCNHEQYTEDGYCTVCGSPQQATWNEASSLYEISNAGQLTWFSKLVNGTLSGTDQNAAANGKLLKDFTVGSVFKAIGSEAIPYTGTFDGGGHTVMLSIDKGSSSYQGLFGAVGGGVIVKNVGVAGTVKGSAFTAGLIGGSSGSGTVTIQNCWNEATVTGTAENAAGVFGCNASGATITIENCYNIGAVSGAKESAGISGWLGNGATVTNCYNAGTVSGAESNKTFARHNNATFTNCYQLNTIGTQDSITAKTLDAFKSGEVTYLMNGSKSEAPLTWGQIIGKDTYPVFYDGNNTVYKIDDNTYSNSLVKLTAGNPSNITVESANISVSGDMGATVYYVKSDTQLTDGNKVEELATAAEQSVILQSDTATISLTNLTENTAYTYYMVAKVGNNYSKVVSVNFKTLLLTPTNSEVTVDYDNELLKSVANNSYTLEYALQSGTTDWKEVTKQGISLTALLNDHSGTENINLYLRKKSGESISDEFAYAITARPDCNVTELAIDYINETVKMPNTVKYQFSVSSPASWDLATNGTNNEVSLNSYISPAGTVVGSLNKIYFRNPATESDFASKTASVTIPARPDTPVAPSAASITDSSVTLTVVTGAEYSKDCTKWQDSPEFIGLEAYANQTFYQRFKATGNSFSSAYSTETIKTDKQSITGATVSLDKTNFIYNGQSQMPTVTVKLDEKTLIESADYTVSYSNSNGNANDTTNVGTITVTVTAKDGSYLGTANSKPTYTIDKATLTPSISGTTNKEYDGDTTIKNGLSISLSGIQNNESVSATADFAYDNKNVDTDKTITASNITLSSDNGNYTLASETATADAGTITAKTVDVTISGDLTHKYDGNANYTHTATYNTIGSDKADVTIKYDDSTTKPYDVKIKDSNVEAYVLTAVINDNNYALGTTLGTKSFTISPAIITGTGASRTLLYTNTATQTASASDFDINKEGVFSSGGDVSGNGNIIESVGYDENVTYALKSGLSYGSQTATIPLIFTPNSKNYAQVKVNLTVSLADKGNSTAPEAFTLQFKLNTDGATYTATIPADDGTEYSFNGTDWSNINTKTNVAPGTSVTGYIRMKETDYKKASGAITDTQTAPLLIVKTPTASPDGGIFSGSQTVTLTCETDGADIYYTTDGSTPSNSSTKYTAAFKVSDTTTVKAMAVKADMKDSEVMTVNYTKNDVSVSLDEANFIYNGKSQTPTVTVKLGEKTLAEGTDYTICYSNSNGKSNDTTNVGTITVMVTAKDGGYFGDFNSESTYTIDKATLTPSTIGTTSKVYDGDTTVDSGLSISLNGMQNNDSVSATADFAYDNKNVGTEKTITASNIILSGDNGNYILASETTTANVGTITAKTVDVTISGDSNYTYDGNTNYAHTTTYTAIESDSANMTIKYDGSATKPYDVKMKNSNVAAYELTAVINDNNYVLGNMFGTTSFTISPAVITANNASKTMLYTNTTTQTAIAANFGINMDGMFTADGEVNDSDNILKSVEYGENVTYTLNSGLGYNSQFATIPVIFTPNSKNYMLVNVNLTVSLADKVSITTPSAFTLQFELNADGATYTATIPAVSDAEYSFNGTDWNNINTKTDVAPGTSVTGYIRMKETEDKNASDVVINTQTAPLLMVKTPTASPVGGNFTGSQTVTLACETEGADIYYTIDGSTPTNSSTKYTEAFVLSDTTTVKSMAVKAGMKSSEVMTVIFTKNSSGGNSGGGTTGGGTIDINTNVTVLVSSNEGSVKATVTVKNNTAIVKISDKQIEEIASGKTKTGKIKLDASDLKVDTVIVPSELVSAANNDSSFSGLEVVLPTGIVTLDKTALNSVGSKGDVKISIDTVSNSKLTDTQKSMLGTQASSAVIVDVNVYVGDNKTSTFNDGKIKVSVHYTLKSHEKAENITVWFIKDDGTIEPKNGVYNSTTGCVDFTTEHLSQYLIVSFPFTDVAESEWCYASVAYAYNNGLFSGTSETIFSPNAAMTRQMIWMVLARMDGKTPANMDEARTWAVENGISDGSNPISTITREQMAVILYRYATYKKYDTTQGGMAIQEFSDYDSISEYALTALDWTVNAGLIQGSNNYVMSSGSTTRAQVATILMRFCQNVAK